MSETGNDTGGTPRKVSLLDRVLGRVPPGGPEITEMLSVKTDEGRQ